MAWTENHTTLNYMLADLYDEKDDSKRVVKASGMSTGLVSFDNQPYTNWFKIIDEADKQNKLIDLLNVIIGPNERGGRDTTLKETINGIINNLKNKQEPISNKVADITWTDTHEPGSVEKILGAKSTLLPISFLEKGLICARSVTRISVRDGLGSGFIIEGNWLITNNHVIPSEQDAAVAVIQFNYQQTISGLDAQYKEFKLSVSRGFFTSKEDDWTIVKVDGDVNKDYGALQFSEKSVEKDDFVNIIQHPSGGPKQIALYHNTVTAVDSKYILYLTDTMPGSSGSPVFNSDWKVVALHHWGGKTKEPFANMNVYRNRGINITKIKQAIIDNNII